MIDLFPSATSEELLQRNIEVVGILLKRFQEQLEYAVTIDPRELSLEKAEVIKKYLEDTVALIKELKKQKQVGHVF